MRILKIDAGNQRFDGIGNRTPTVGVRIYLFKFSSIEPQYLCVLTQSNAQQQSMMRGIEPVLSESESSALPFPL